MSWVREERPEDGRGHKRVVYHLRKRRRPMIWFALIGVILAVSVYLVYRFRACETKLEALGRALAEKRPKESLALGASFSIPYAKWLISHFEIEGGRWQDFLEEVCLAGLNPLRLAMEWDEVEKIPGKRDFSEILEAIGIARKHKREVVLCLGLKNPRWPEVHPPDWLADEVQKSGLSLGGEAIRKPLLGFLTASLLHFRTKVSYFQVENEPFTLNPQRIAQALLREEVQHVRSLVAPATAIVLTTFGQQDKHPAIALRILKNHLEKLLPLADIIGLDCYQKSHFFEARDGNWGVISKAAEKIHQANKRFWITELQAEPWEKDPAKMELEDPCGNDSYTPKLYATTLQRARALEPQAILLWGVEFQLACQAKGNSQWWQVTLEAIED